MNNQLAKQTYIHKKTGYAMEMISDDFNLIARFTGLFAKADDIVGAQFYYTNPLIYMIVEGEIEGACLYGDYYLLDIESWGEIVLQHPVLAVNQVFLERIGDPKGLFQEFEMSTFKKYHNIHGMYIVGIKET